MKVDDKTFKATLERSWKSYQSKYMDEGSHGRGMRKMLSEEAYKQKFTFNTQTGQSNAGFSKKAFQESVVFSYAEAHKIATSLIESGLSEMDYMSLGFDYDEFGKNKDGSINKASLRAQIMQMDSKQAHDFVMMAIDLDYFFNGRDFEATAY